LLPFDDTHSENSEVFVQITGVSWNRAGCQTWQWWKLCAISVYLFIALYHSFFIWYI